jgi:hypothetical protein
MPSDVVVLTEITNQTKQAWLAQAQYPDVTSMCITPDWVATIGARPRYLPNMEKGLDRPNIGASILLSLLSTLITAIWYFSRFPSPFRSLWE